MAEKKQNAEKSDFFHYLRILIAVLLIVFVVLASVIAFRFGYSVFTDEPLTTARVEHVTYDLLVTEGESVLEVGKALEQNGIISSAIVFLAQSKIYKCRIVPGIYTVSSRESSKAILKRMETEYEKTLQEE